MSWVTTLFESHSSLFFFCGKEGGGSGGGNVSFFSSPFTFVAGAGYFSKQDIIFRKAFEERIKAAVMIGRLICVGFMIWI